MISSKFFTQVRPANMTLSGVVLCGFGHSPALVGGPKSFSVKPTVAENSTFMTYPVMAELNDHDRTDEWVNMIITFTTQGPASGYAPQYRFGTQPPGVNFTTQGNTITLTGDSDGIAAAAKTLQVKPGTGNGEDIIVNITGTARGIGTTVTATVNTSFVIPVDPVIQRALHVTVSANITTAEDALTPISGVNVSIIGDDDLDGSEEIVLEIKDLTFPNGTKLFVGSIQLQTVTNGWFRVATDVVPSLKFQAPGHFSGGFPLIARGVIIDTTASNVVVTATAEQTLNIMVLPVADGLATPSSVTGVEDNGPVKFGAALASSMTVIDNGNMTLIGNNPEPETISIISVVVPADTSAITYNVSGTFVPVQGGTIPGSGSAVVAFNSTTRTYTITSTVLTSSSNIALLSLPTRQQAESDIRQTFATFEVTIGPQHTDSNGQLMVTVTTQDVNLGVVSSNTTSFMPIRIQAVADPPSLSVATPLSATNEETSVSLNVTVSRSADDDGSETLSVRFTIPKDSSGPIGIVKGVPPSSVTLANQGDGVYLVTSTGSTPLIRENNLNSFLQGNIMFEPRNGFSGQYIANGTGIKVEAISTEGASGSELAPNSFGGADGSAKTETASAWIQLTVNPVADDPLVSVKGNAAGSEDVRSTVASTQLWCRTIRKLTLSVSTDTNSHSFGSYAWRSRRIRNVPDENYQSPPRGG